MSENKLCLCSPRRVFSLGLAKFNCHFHRKEIRPVCLVKIVCCKLTYLLCLVRQHHWISLRFGLFLDQNKNVVNCVGMSLAEQPREKVSAKAQP